MTLKHSSRLLLGVLVLVFLSAARVFGGELPIVNYIKRLEFLSAEFEELRFSPQGHLVSLSRGKCKIHKPGKFYWEYSVPFEQLIVSDGDTLWVSEPELDQVIISAISTMSSTALGPLLGSSESLDKLYTFEAMSEENWFHLDPVHSLERGNETKVEVKFMDGKIDAMRLLDGLGFVTKVIFSKVDHKPFESGIFDFVPPEHVDVINTQFNKETEN
jgi:outer membrane lipoprotein carrier protein